MNSERERRITSIFHSAIEREGTERRAFLDGACGGDAELRSEVEALIRSHESAGSMLDAPAYERGAELLAESADFTGRVLGHYRVVRHLGSGGMGEVYLAEDTQLGRRAAIKLLPRRLTSDPALVARFRQEARAASALNHPNIVTIYEIGEQEGTHFIASEFVDGQTLRERISQIPLSINEAINVAMQVASALAKAHAAGVVHRDVKPENVMVDDEGHAKVLDFGIAKLTEQTDSSQTEAPTFLKVKTSPGAVIGTAHYMSPEQARALKDVDARTDVWSLGVVLYEMLSGRQPFEGETPSDVMAAILNKEPQPLIRFNREVSEALDLVVQKALTKDRNERYQSAREILSDLRRVKQRLEGISTAEIEERRSVTSTATPTPGETSGADRFPTGAPPTVHTTSSAEYIVTGIKRHKWAVIGGLAVVVIFASGITFALYKYASLQKPEQVFQNFTLSRVTTSGRASEANISPDGRYVVYVEEDEAGNQGILVRQTATGNTLQIVPPSKTWLGGSVFSPDSNFVYYLANDLSSDITSLYRVPSIGGDTKQVLSDIDSPVTFSPDGQRIAYVREEREVKFELVVANVDGTSERTLATRSGSDWFNDDGPSWSPDGKTIACAGGSAINEKNEFMLFGIDVETGAVSQLSPKKWNAAIGRVVWMPDGFSLMLIAMEQVSNDRNQLWRISYPSGEASRITNDVQARNEGSLGVTTDGRTLITVVQQTLTRIETLPANGDISRVTRLSIGAANYEGLYGVACAPDGRIVFSSSEGGQSDLWIMNTDGSGRKRLTSDAYWDGELAVSPDGRYIVFASNRASGAATAQLWRMDIDGSNLTQLTHREDRHPDISPDGRSVIYSSWAPEPQGVVTGQTMWKVSIDGGAPVQLTDYTAQVPAFSPNGQWIAFISFDEQVVPKRWRSAIIPSTGGIKPVKQFDRPNYTWQYVRWTTDGRHLSYIGPPAVPSNIWLQPVDGGEPKKLSDFKTEMIFRHAWSRDGRTLVVVRGTVITDIVLMRDN